MADIDKNNFIDLFDEVVKNLPAYNSKARKDLRIKYALDNSYPRQIAKIESICENTS